jgi:transposase-like protein
MENGAKRRLRPEEQFEVYLETVRHDAPIAEVLRRHGLHSTELVRIRERVREGAVEALGRDRRRKAKAVPLAEHQALAAEAQRLKETLVRQTVSYQLLEKKVSGV